jgi:hypothetical protein
MSRAIKNLMTKLWSSSSKEKLNKYLAHEVREEEPNQGFKKVKVNTL